MVILDICLLQVFKRVNEHCYLYACFLQVSSVCKQSMDNSMKQVNKFAEHMDFRKKTGYGMTCIFQGNSHVHQVTYGHYLKRYVEFENQQT